MSARAWRLLEWTIKVVVGTACAVIISLLLANDPSGDDVVRGIAAAIPALIAGGITGRK